MCTLIAFHRVWEDAPLVVAANRDERYDRPARRPEWDGDPPALAPRDVAAGGTWMGANRSGVLAGITNRHGARPNEPTRRSRGLLCRDLLRATTADAVVDALERLAEPYNPFHIVCGDGESLFLVEYEEGRVEARQLGAGCHVVTNEPFDVSGSEPKVLRARTLLERAGLWPAGLDGAVPARLFDSLEAILADHGLYGPDAICLHGGRYGTRSSAVWRVAPSAVRKRRAAGIVERRAFEAAYADGPPCATAFEPIPWLEE